MKTFKILIFATLISIVYSETSMATSLDEIYRDIVKSDNNGYLPLFVKNRNAPNFLDEEDTLRQVKKAVSISDKEELKAIKLENERKIREQALQAEKLKWQRTIEAIQAGKVTPVELHEVEKRVEKKDLHAIEIYAWMFARGVGVKQDLVKSFHLYQIAAHKNVPQAAKNAALVYKAMNREQRESLTSYGNTQSL